MRIVFYNGPMLWLYLYYITTTYQTISQLKPNQKILLQAWKMIVLGLG